MLFLCLTGCCLSPITSFNCPKFTLLSSSTRPRGKRLLAFAGFPRSQLPLVSLVIRLLLYRCLAFLSTAHSHSFMVIVMKGALVYRGDESMVEMAIVLILVLAEKLLVRMVFIQAVSLRLLPSLLVVRDVRSCIKGTLVTSVVVFIIFRGIVVRWSMPLVVVGCAAFREVVLNQCVAVNRQPIHYLWPGPLDSSIDYSIGRGQIVNGAMAVLRMIRWSLQDRHLFHAVVLLSDEVVCAQGLVKPVRSLEVCLRLRGLLIIVVIVCSRASRGPNLLVLGLLEKCRL